ncbi:unnamed protein product [Ixodes pacificus]
MSRTVHLLSYTRKINVIYLKEKRLLRNPSRENRFDGVARCSRFQRSSRHPVEKTRNREAGRYRPYKWRYKNCASWWPKLKTKERGVNVRSWSCAYSTPCRFSVLRRISFRACSQSR